MKLITITIVSIGFLLLGCGNENDQIRAVKNHIIRTGEYSDDELKQAEFSVQEMSDEEAYRMILNYRYDMAKSLKDVSDDMYEEAIIGFGLEDGVENALKELKSTGIATGKEIYYRVNFKRSVGGVDTNDEFFILDNKNQVISLL